MDIVDKILWGRLQIDRRCEFPWYFTGNKMVDMVIELVPVIMVCGIVMGFIKLLPAVATKRHPISILITKCRMKLNIVFYKPRMVIMRAGRYLFGDPIRS